MTQEIEAVAKAIDKAEDHLFERTASALYFGKAQAAIDTLKSLGWLPPAEREAPSEPFVKDVQRILNKHSAWIARPNKAVEEAIASAVIYKVQSFGWKPPYSADEIDTIINVEREAIRAAALMEAAEKCDEFITLYRRAADLSDDNSHTKDRNHARQSATINAKSAIKSLATMPPEYVVVKRGEFEQAEENLASRDEFIVSKGLWMEFVEQLPKINHLDISDTKDTP